MEKYMWRVVMHDGYLDDPICVAMFLLETDAREWAGEQNKGTEENYSVMPPAK